MSAKTLEEKVAYFKEQDLLDISDDETGFPDEGLLNAERALADTKAMPPPRLVRQGSTFLGPTPKERQAAFEAYSARRRAATRNDGPGLTRSATEPEADVARSFPSANSTTKSPPGLGKKLKRNVSLPDLPSAALEEERVPFYKRVGAIPRQLKSGKSVKLADNIRVEPEHKQLLKGKIIYFYPNDDVSSARRQRIHKVIQLGAAWVTIWRDDITHVMVDDAEHIYSQVLKHLNRAGLPRKVVLVRFDPYVPQCIQLNTLLEPTAKRFLVEGAPRSTVSTAAPEPPSLPASQVSLQVKLSRRQQAARESQVTDVVSVEDSFPPPLPSVVPLSSPLEERVEDSFISPSSDPVIPTDSIDEPTKSYDDPLSQAILETKAISHLPLDEDEDSEPSHSRPSTSEDHDSEPGTDEEAPKPAPRRSKKFTSTSISNRKGSSKGLNQLTFQCMDPANSSTSSQNPNARTIQILDEMCKYYDQMQDPWRTLAYRRGIGTLRKQTSKIITKEQAEALPFIGSRLAEKIEEIVLTDRLRKLDNTREDPTDQVLRLFLGIYGVGLSQANKWIQAGHRTLDDLVAKAKLTDSQKIGIEHYSDFAARIPRAEVEAHGAYVRTALQRIDAAFQVWVMGSYRRGAEDSGDIDLIITKPGTPLSAMRTTIFTSLLPRLFSSSFLKASLATSHRNDDTGSKWLGASCLPSSTIWRRLDLLLVPESEMGAALIYFTGNDIFNRSIRLLASKKGMRLNQRGLYKDVMRGAKREKLTEGTLVESRSERKIFEVLGVPWRAPEERIC